MSLIKPQTIPYHRGTHLIPSGDVCYALPCFYCFDCFYPFFYTEFGHNKTAPFLLVGVQLLGCSSSHGSFDFKAWNGRGCSEGLRSNLRNRGDGGRRVCLYRWDIYICHQLPRRKDGTDIPGGLSSFRTGP